MTNNSHDHEKKQQLLQVSELTEVEKTYSLSALTILKERYLLKDDMGNTVERPHELLQRVAVGVGIMEVLYADKMYNKDYETCHESFIELAKQELTDLQKELTDLDYKDLTMHPRCIKLGEFIVNPFHYERLLARYIELAIEGKMEGSIGYIMDRLDYDKVFRSKIVRIIQRYYDLMAQQVFLPNTPALMNCGTKLNMNAACFTLEMHDDLDHIYKTNWDVAKVFKAGGGIGINYSELRPEGAYVRGTGGKSSGTLSWLKQTDETTGRVAQGGKRRGASMGILNMNHPEIERFIDLKDNKTLENHNISICTPNSFFTTFLHGDQHNRYLMDKISANAWKTGDPGMVFLDHMNINNLLEDVVGKKIDVTNPCSEIAMYPYESCILASINLGKFVSEEEGFDFREFGEVVGTVTQFLDSLIDATKYPIPEINDMTKKCRRIGVGFMGLADMLVKLEIPYNSEEGFKAAEHICEILTTTALYKSHKLAEEKGAFPLWHHEKYPRHKAPVIADPSGGLELRNCSVTTIAPTGTLSMLADCSSGIEPLFSLSYKKKVTLGEFEYLDENYEKALANGMKEEDLKRIFVTAMDIHPFDHLMMQAAAQKWITNGISKTINMAGDVTEKMIEHVYVLAWALGNKGISIYRDGCKSAQVLNTSNKKKAGDLKISDYTLEKIKALDVLPDSYKQEMLSPPEVMIIPSPPPFNTALTYPSNDTVLVSSSGGTSFTYTTTISEFYETSTCKNCNAINTFEILSRSCHICRSCGTSSGSCS